MYRQVYTFSSEIAYVLSTDFPASPYCFRIRIGIGANTIRCSLYLWTVGLTNQKLGVPDFLYIAIHQMSAKTFIDKRFYCRHFLMMLL